MPDKQIPFEQSAEFFYRRAQKHVEERDSVTALPLYRRALEMEPGLPGCLLDYVRALPHGDGGTEPMRFIFGRFEGRAEEYAAMAFVCMMVWRNAPSAYRALLAAWAAVRSQDEKLERFLLAAVKMTSMLRLLGVGRNDSRRTAKGERLYRLSRRALDEGRLNTALRQSVRALELNPQDQARLVRARTLLKMGRRQEAVALCGPLAMKQAEALKEHKYYFDSSYLKEQAALRDTVRTLIEADAAGLAQRALNTLFQGNIPAKMMWQLVEFIPLLPLESVYRALMKGLEGQPNDQNMLHAAAAASLKCERPVSEAVALWRHMLDVDPDDPIARAYIAAWQQGELERDRVPFERRLTKVMRERCLQALRERPTGETLYALCRWAWRDGGDTNVGTEDAPVYEKAAAAAMRLLAADESEKATCLMREALADPKLDAAARALALTELQRRGVPGPIPVCWPSGLTFEGMRPDELPRVTQMQERLWHRVDRLRDPEGRNYALWKETAPIWCELVRRRVRIPARELRGMTAAVFFRAAQARKMNMTEKRAARECGCTLRQLRRCLNILDHRCKGE